MDKDPPNLNTGTSHGDEFSQSSPSNIQWPAGFSFQQTLMHPYNPNLIFQQYQAQQHMAQLSGVYPTYSTPPVDMVNGLQGPLGYPNREEEHDHSQPSHTEPPSQDTEENSEGLARAGNWSTLEDTRLCRAWVRVSTDPIAGADQKKSSFWNRVFNGFCNQHQKNEFVIRSQKGCHLRFQHIKADLNKWSAALKKVRDFPRSGANQAMEEKTAHAYYRDQIGKPFKLEHCWDILSKCAKFMLLLGVKPAKNDEINCPIPRSGSTVAPPSFKSTSSCARPSSSTRRAEESSTRFTGEVQPENVTGETPSVRTTGFSSPSRIDLDSHDVALDDDPPLAGARPPGRKAAKEMRRAKRQGSSEAHSAIGERVAKSLDEIQAASSVGWKRANELYEEEQRHSIKHMKLQHLRDRLAFEKDLIIAEKELYEFENSAIGSPSDKAKVAAIAATRKRKLAELQAQANALDEFESSPAPSTSRQNACNLSSRFDEEEAND